MKLPSFSVVQNRLIGYLFSATLFLASVIVIAVWGIPLGVDFTGGNRLEVTIAPSDISLDVEKINKKIETLGLGSFSIQASVNGLLVIRSQNLLTPTDEELILSSIRNIAKEQSDQVVVEKLTSYAIGPVIGQELRAKSFWAIGLVLIAIILFITFSFRKVPEPVASWKYGITAIIALIHDVVITIGTFSVLGYFFGAEADTLFVTALLTVLGFSVHDTIVVFDRVRENLKQNTKDFGTIVSQSVNQTAGRSIANSFTSLLVLASIIIFGGESIRWFVSTLFIGILIGTYSSIFVAAPLLVDFQKKSFSSKSL
jgi:preprotein translocase subunit SecF